MVARADHLLGRRWHWARLLARRYAKAMAGRTRPTWLETYRFLEDDGALWRATQRYPKAVVVANWLIGPPRMAPVPAAEHWDLPRIESVGDLADWLWLEHGDLDWFADLRSLGNKLGKPKLQHYHYQLLPKRNGVRVIEMPKRRLKRIQRQVLAYLLDGVPVHSAVHRFVKGRSILTFAAPHQGQRVVLRMDLADFFPAIRAARVGALFRTFGYPESVANLLAGLCTNAIPASVLRGVPFAQRQVYQRPHLPQGAPTSPSLANLCAYRADCRLRGLAEATGAVYTRYADDLAFSGGADFARQVHRFVPQAAAILQEEGFAVNHRKTRVMRPGQRQHLAGLVVNETPNVPREQFDELKAILTNCVRHGAESQNREGHSHFRAHLMGRVAFFEQVNPVKGARLRVLFEQIRWL